MLRNGYDITIDETEQHTIFPLLCCLLHVIKFSQINIAWNIVGVTPHVKMMFLIATISQNHKS